jgi:hypothetical protein
MFALLYDAPWKENYVSDDTTKDTFLIDVTSIKMCFLDNFIILFMEQWTP